MVFCQDSPSIYSLSLVPEIAESLCSYSDDEGEKENSGEGGKGTVYDSSRYVHMQKMAKNGNL